jgi:signal transduction histidine kinase
VFLNLLSNAVKFTDKDGKIMIKVEHQVKAVEGQFQNYIKVSIEDTGIGIKKKN